MLSGYCGAGITGSPPRRKATAPSTRTVTVTDGAETSGVEFYLLPVTEVTVFGHPRPGPIPDNDPERDSRTN